MEKITLFRSGMSNLRFTGEEVAFVSTRDHSSTRWTEYKLYNTDKGKVIFYRQDITQWQGEQDYYRADIYNNIKELIAEVVDDEVVDDYIKYLLKEYGEEIVEEI